MHETAENVELSVTEVSNYAHFLGMNDAWNTLLSKRSRPSVFLRHEWFDAAWQWCKNTSNMRLLCTFQGSDMIAVAPIVATELRKHLILHSQLSFIQVPDTQECDVVASDDNSAIAVTSVIEYLSNRKDWDIVVFPKLPPDGALTAHAVDACKKRRINYVMTDTGENIEVDLTANWESYYSNRSRRLRTSNNNCRNKVHADGNTVNLHWLVNAGSATTDITDVLSALKHISSVSWKKHTGLTLDNVGPGAFIDRLSEHALQNDWLSIWALDINDIIVAVEYQLIYEGVVVALRADFDPSFAKLSPGSYLNWRILESLFSSDNSLYRMGPGSNPYKLRWSNSYTPLREVRMYNKTLKGHFFWIIEARLRPLIRRLKQLISRVRERASRNA